MSSKKLVERQVRWSQTLSQFNFRIEFRAGKKATRPDAISRRAQDAPTDPNDPRHREREFQLLKSNWLPSQFEGSLIDINNINPRKNKSIPAGRDLFEENDFKVLWDKAVVTDSSFGDIYKAFWNNERVFPSKLNLKVSMNECQIDPRGALYFRYRLWIPNSEQLQTPLIHKTHDSYITGHPRRNINLAILLRSFY